MPKPLEGGCACGAVRYRLTSPPMFVNCCHCLDCQRQTGSAFAINAIIETDRIDVTQGDIAIATVPTDSGRPLDIHGCATCGTSLWSDYGRRPTVRFVRVGTLDDPGALSPNAHIFTRSKQPWVGLPKEVPAFEIYYETGQLWPKESLERRRALPA